MIKVSHEMPFFMMEDGSEKKYNDYSYALVHLFKDNKKYFDYFAEALKQGRHVILDNSAFELGEAFDSDEFVKWIERLVMRSGEAKCKLTYVIPDALHDKDKTIALAKEFTEKYPNCYGRAMAVCQGQTYDEMIECYKELVEYADYIGISFGSASHTNEFPDLGKDHARTVGRVCLLQEMYTRGLLTEEIDIHLLGAQLPFEFYYYTNIYPHLSRFVKSLDTSSPIIHGLNSVRYEGGFGLDTKIDTKLADLMEMTRPDDSVMDCVIYNIEQFKIQNGLVVVE